VVRKRLTRLGGALVAAGSLALVCSASAGAAQSAKQLLQQAISATESAPSFTLTGTVKEAKQTISFRVSSNTTTGQGEGTLSLRKGTAQMRLVSGTVYLKGDAKFWTNESGKSAAKELAGLWVSTAATSTTGKQLSSFVNGAEFLKELFNSNPTNSVFTFDGTTTVDGQPATVISGHDKKTNTGGKVDVAKSSPTYVLRLAFDSSSGSGALTFSGYNQPVNPVAPTGAIDLDTLGGG
jgi:hypothetical protein